MLTFQTDSPQNCGIVQRDKDMIVQKFFEKVENPPGNIANGAIYVFESNLIEKLSESYSNLNDFSKDVIPLFLGKIFFNEEVNKTKVVGVIALSIGVYFIV